MKKSGLVFIAGVLVSCFTLAGCAKSASEVYSQKPNAEVTPIADNDTTIHDKEILVVSFGTSYNESRDKTIGAIEETIQKTFPDYNVQRAFTSQIIIDKLAERDGLEIDNVEEALDRAVTKGVKTLIVQPTHLMNGFEYTDLANALEEYKDKFEKVALAEPLLTSDEDFKKVINALVAEASSYDDGETAICFMGHGTEADSNGVYTKLQEVFTAGGHKNYFVGTVEAAPSLEDVIAQVKAGSYKKVVLQPLMVVAGDHANNDMAGEEEDSWKKQFENAGYEVKAILKGMGEFTGIQAIYAEHTQAAIDSLK